MSQTFHRFKNALNDSIAGLVDHSATHVSVSYGDEDLGTVRTVSITSDQVLILTTEPIGDSDFAGVGIISILADLDELAHRADEVQDIFVVDWEGNAFGALSSVDRSHPLNDDSVQVTLQVTSELSIV